ncbi:hypothetical protein AAF712_011158 [Marasmius tenuissimus]|uniref:Uncharacterized protein n=1 Tax=Marasmius tenuissimus TaxID=585030 RepID=A0ABR2ZLG0_9AGAR
MFSHSKNKNCSQHKIPTMFEPCEDDLHITRTPIEESYAEITYQAARQLDIYYFSQDPRPSLEELAKPLYAAWSKVWSNPLDLGAVRLEAGSDREKAANILEKQLIADAVAAHVNYQRNVEAHFDLPVQAEGAATWAEAVENIIQCGQWARWASIDYSKALRSMKRAERKRSEKHMGAWLLPAFGAAGNQETWKKMGDVMSNADTTYDKALQDFLGKKY